MSLIELSARYVLGEVFTDDLPALAVDVILQGSDSPSLAALAGVTRDTAPAELRDLFEHALAELRIPVPSKLNAGQILKTILAQRVLDGDLSPQVAAREIVSIYHSLHKEIKDHQYAGDGFDIANLFGAYHSYDDYHDNPGAARAAIDRTIVEECRRIVATFPLSAG